MKKINKIPAAAVAVLILTLLFAILSSGLDFEGSDFIQPVIFAIAATICIFYSPFRKYILIIATALLTLMVATYLINKFDLSNWIGSLGFGAFTIVVFSYIPQLIKKGHIEKY